jgi:inorganic pyrophosphatase
MMEKIIKVRIEIPMASDPIKYEVDPDTGDIYLDRFLGTSMRYPTNYGFMPGTLAPDGDPLDVLVLSPYPLLSGCIAKCRVIGVLRMIDEEGEDHKILTVPIGDYYADYMDIKNVPIRLLSCIRHFFEHYKDLDRDRWVNVLGWEDGTVAKEVIKKYDNINPYTK